MHRRVDWVRWAVRGHKGFTLTRDEIKNGITAQEFVRGLERNEEGSWIWNVGSDTSESTQTGASSIIEDNGKAYTLADLDNLLGVRAIISTSSLEMKKECIDLSQCLFETAQGTLASGQSSPTRLLKPPMTTTKNPDLTIVPINSPLQDTSSATSVKSAAKNGGNDQHQSSSVIGGKRPRDSDEENQSLRRSVLPVKAFSLTVCIILLILVSTLIE